MQPAGCFPSFFRRPGPRGQFATPKNAPNVPCLPPSNERHHPATARRHPVALVRSRCRMQRQIGRFSEATLLMEMDVADLKSDGSAGRNQG
eukprot:scaffold7448_cov19-Phaeocystis_antarctica.AAC.1